ncbi:folate family ECF transporter S component [Oscillospiraceae bacterium NSJ-64]|uniref:Folate family ECF transporter S component n=2 Tax=Youxingia wuxianensis TaxID=2763678 RepID=A0A926ERB8_9FIRM|nr:folate family ECF transporter S component [Youxingia wuxianensis]
MLAALNVILHQLTVIISLTQQISFAFITVGISGMLYGPMLTGMIGIATDILKYIVKPNGGFFPGFTLSEFVLGFIYGLFLYKKEVTLARVFCAQLTVTLVIDLTLTSLWLSMMYGQAFIVLVGARLVKNIVMLPVKTAILYFLAKKVSEIRVRRLA